MALLERFIKGPAVSGTITDSDGNPLHAEVRVVEIRPRAGEKWLTRPRDGMFARYLPEPGSYTLDVRAPGFESQRVRFNVKDGTSKIGLAVTLNRRAASADAEVRGQ